MNSAETLQVTRIPDGELVTRILQGDKDLYAIIVRRYNQRLYRIGMSILNDDTEIEDSMQVAYINAYENLAKFASRASFSTWLTRIMINECLLRLRRRGKTIILNNDIMDFEIQKEKGGETQSPATIVLHAELKLILEDAIGKLPEIYRTVFIMREIESMSIAETSECLGLSGVNVKVRLNRAKAMLREMLASYYKQEDILHFHLSRCDRVVQNVMSSVQNA